MLFMHQRGCGPHQHSHHHGHMRRRGHWSEGEDWPGRHGRGRGRHRMFDGGELKLVLLRLIREEARHGYDLIKAVETLTGGAYAPSPGVVYPTLTLLKDMGFVEEIDNPSSSRKLYQVTEEGIAHLEQQQELVGELIKRLESVAEARGRTDALPVRRAMNNLRTALIDKLTRGAKRETVLDIAALIDEAAQKIERL